MHWPHTALQCIFSTIIFQCKEKKASSHFWKWGFPLKLQWHMNPFQLKLNLAAVVFFSPNQRQDIRTHADCSCPAQRFAVHFLKAGIFSSPLYFFIVFFFSTKKQTKKKNTLGLCYHGHVSNACHCRNSRNKCYNFNRRGARLQTDFQYRRSDSRDHSLHFMPAVP